MVTKRGQLVGDAVGLKVGVEVHLGTRQEKASRQMEPHVQRLGSMFQKVWGVEPGRKGQASWGRQSGRGGNKWGMVGRQKLRTEEEIGEQGARELGGRWQEFIRGQSEAKGQRDPHTIGAGYSSDRQIPREAMATRSRCCY